MAPIPDELKATTADFIKAFGEREAIELTFPDDPSQLDPDLETIQCWLDDAFNEICAYDLLACLAGQVAIRKSLRRDMLSIARYYGDVCLLRPQVKEAAQAARDRLMDWSDNKWCNRSPSQDDLEAVGLLPRSCSAISANKRVFTNKSLRKFRTMPLLTNGRRSITDVDNDFLDKH
jgi:phage gp36-like protein